MSKQFFRSIDDVKANEQEVSGYIREPKLREYVEKALENGCYLTIEYGHGANICSEIDSNGEHVVFSQGVYNDPKGNTFVTIDDSTESVNRCKECRGINIWDTEALLKASRVCGKCGKPVERFSDLNHHLYAGLACDDCIGGIRAYENSKPSGWWTC